MNGPSKVMKHGRVRWMVDLRSFGGGREFFESQQAAWKRTAEAVTEQERFGRLAFDLGHKERTRYLAIEAKLAERGVTIEEVIAHWDKTHMVVETKPVGEAAQECLKAKEAAGRRKNSIVQLRCGFKSFVAKVGEDTLCHNITHTHIEQWLNNPKWGMRTRQGGLANMRTLFAYVIKRGWALSNPAARVEPIVVDVKPPGILTVAQVERLMLSAQKNCPSFLPFVTLGLFAGVRPEEIKQLSWKEINLETGYCEIPAHIAKRVKGGGSRQRRLIKLQPNAIAWLRFKGDLPPVSWQDRWDRVRKGAGFSVSYRRKSRRLRTKGEPWPKNAMRHSFCSYCLPIFGELKESEWAGHSPQMAISRYRELVTKEEAEKFWAIMPVGETKQTKGDHEQTSSDGSGAMRERAGGND